MKEKVDCNCHAVLPPHSNENSYTLNVGDLFSSSKAFAVEMQHYLTKESFDYIITFSGVLLEKLGVLVRLRPKNVTLIMTKI